MFTSRYSNSRLHLGLLFGMFGSVFIWLPHVIFIVISMSRFNSPRGHTPPLPDTFPRASLSSHHLSLRHRSIGLHTPFSSIFSLSVLILRAATLLPCPTHFPARSFYSLSSSLRHKISDCISAIAHFNFASNSTESLQVPPSHC